MAQQNENLEKVMDGFLTQLTVIKEETKKDTDRAVEAANTTVVATCPCRFSQIEQAKT